MNSQEVIDILTSNIDTLWVIDCAILVFIMQAGFMCMETGLSRHKNSINIALKNAADFGVSVVIFWIFGFGLMFGTSYTLTAKEKGSKAEKCEITLSRSGLLDKGTHC